MTESPEMNSVMDDLMRNGTFPSNSTEGICFNFENSAGAIAIQFIMAVLILLLNSIVVSVVVGGPKSTYRKPAFVFIASLASCDILLALALLAFSAVSIGQYQLTTHAWVILTASTSVCFNASVNFLLVIAADRLCFIGYNRKYSNIMTKRRVWILIVLCWTVALIPVLPMLINGEGSCVGKCKCYSGQRLDCSHDKTCSTVVNGFKKNFLFGLFFYFLFMLISIGVIYYILFSKVRHHASKVRSLVVSSKRSKSNNMKREFRLARTLGIVVAVFFCCWTPLLLFYVVDFATPDSFELNENFTFALMSPAILNSLCNPIIYAARIPRMRRYLCPCSRGSEETSTDGSRRSFTARRGHYANGKPIGVKNGMAKTTNGVREENGKTSIRASQFRSQASSKDFSSSSACEQHHEPSELKRTNTVNSWLGNHLACISGRGGTSEEPEKSERNGRKSSAREEEKKAAERKNGCCQDNNANREIASLSVRVDEGVEILDEGKL